MYDIEKVRADFPALKQHVHDKPLIYLDSAATTQKPEVVIETIADFYRYTSANVHRGAHTLSARATDLYEQARSKVAAFINARHNEEIIFVRNATEAINIAARCWGDLNIQSGDEILLTNLEHHSNLVPWQMLAKRKGANLCFVDADENGDINIADFKEKISSKTKIVTFTAMSNVLGTVTPAAELTEIARSSGARVLIDGAQSVAHMNTDVQDLDCDFLAFSGHKMCGPTGIGVLYARKELLDEMEPLLGGGDMIGRVGRESSTWAAVPNKFEAGTPAIAQAVGLAVAVDYINELGMQNILEHEQKLVKIARDRLSGVDGLSIFGSPAQQSGALSFNLKGVHPHDLAQILDSEGLALRAGHHCAQPLMDSLGVKSTIRASFYFYNKESEIDILISGLNKAKGYFSNVLG